ncbi:MAG: hypothetical protein KU38_01600 [Sulfurovum sp. FS08-3]|nr:MAG: hypothetical protein KU38_01600 [Sulfurovum sp. FS08-3]
MCGFYFFSGVFAFSLIYSLKEHPSKLLLIGGIFFGLSHIVQIIHPMTTAFIQRYVLYIDMMFLFLTILTFVAWIDIQGYSKRYKTSFLWIGHSTYSIYLWHFPIQILILFIFDYFHLNRDIFNSEVVFILWISFMIVIGRLSYQWIEKPLQTKIRQKFKR